MQTRVLKVDATAPEPSVVAEAAAVILAGGLVAFPTETVYGLGANALDADAVGGIFRAKGRPAYDPLIVHLADPAHLPTVVAHVPPVAWSLAEAFWPGPLTLVLPRGPEIPLAVTAGGPTVAVRVPSHPVAQALIRAAAVPVAAPSANRFGRVSPTSAQHVLADLDGRIDMILDGGQTPVGVESTVLSLAGDMPVILRPGGVSREALCAVLGTVALRQEVVARDGASAERAFEEMAAESTPLTSPGTTLKHYAPRAHLTLYQGPRGAVLATMQAAARHQVAAGERVGVLIAEEDVEAFEALPVICKAVGSMLDLPDVARRLYGVLRALDAGGVTVILARDFGIEGLGLAIRDRLTRAAAGRVVRVSE